MCWSSRPNPWLTTWRSPARSRSSCGSPATGRTPTSPFKLIDLYPPSADWPEGFALNLTDGILRCRYRGQLGAAFDDDARRGPIRSPSRRFPTSNLFKAGHRIRLDISSSNFPRFDVNTEHRARRKARASTGGWRRTASSSTPRGRAMCCCRSSRGRGLMKLPSDRRRRPAAGLDGRGAGPPTLLDPTPRTAVITAFAPEIVPLAAALSDRRSYRVSGTEVHHRDAGGQAGGPVPVGRLDGQRGDEHPARCLEPVSGSPASSSSGHRRRAWTRASTSATWSSPTSGANTWRA